MIPKPERDELREKATTALNMIAELCEGARHWEMSIPARPDEDVDLVLAGVVGALPHVLDALDAAEARIAELELDAKIMAPWVQDGSQGVWDTVDKHKP